MNSSPVFLNHIRRIQDLPVSNDARSSILSANDGNFQDTLLEQMSSEDDDDQFRTKGNKICHVSLKFFYVFLHSLHGHHF